MEGNIYVRRGDEGSSIVVCSDNFRRFETVAVLSDDEARKLRDDIDALLSGIDKKEQSND